MGMARSGLVQPGAHAHHDRAVGQVHGHGGEPGGKDWGVNEAGIGRPRPGAPDADNVEITRRIFR